MAKKAALHNLGCKVNAYETEAMRQLLEKEGYEIVPFAPGADVYVINTCTVTNIADRKSRQMLHKAKKMNPDAIVVAAGCYVQTVENPVEDDLTVDLVLGNNRKKDLIEALRSLEKARAESDVSACRECIADNESGLTGDTEAVQSEDAGRSQQETDRQSYITDINHTHEYENLSISRTEEHTRAYVKVQDGCNQFCTYCIIPYARGRVRSREMEDVLQEVRKLADSGCREVVLTGIHLTSYGSDLGISLLDLIRAVHTVPGIERIRLGSLEPGFITKKTAMVLHDLPKVCPHFHISLQSGCTSVLRRMNRRYTAEEFEEKCEILRSVYDCPAITTDVIVGFPQETLEEFQETASFLKKLRLYETHIFKYSSRQGTRAAAMSGQIPETEKGIRSNVLIELGEQNRSLFEQGYSGRKVEALFEEPLEINGTNYFAGYTKEYMRVAIPAVEDFSNQILTGRIGKPLSSHLFLLEKD
ncbi:MAG: tRNA (N(6)-L-threonylcarbamoyladenosine(37)-C(2))-methylthiotransferase MtaB [Clostridiales bacterium]|nr:tRNA (N(6)-L-threonylcarbamoyladenosine(37)-C(2))-methylthiotransferase MtaB [Clostridiales bacterium]